MFLREFITKIIFISKHFSYNIHFLNIVSLRWCPLSTYSRKRFWKFCITRCTMVGETAATSSLMFCFKSTVVLGFFSYTLLLSYPRVRSRRRWDRAILQAIQYSLFVRSRELGTSRWALALQSSQCEPLPRLAETRESGFQHQVSANPVPEMCEASQCRWLNLLLLTCLPRLQRNRGRSPQKMLRHTKQ